MISNITRTPACFVFVLCSLAANAADTPFADQSPNTWVKRSPLSNAPVSPRLGYEGSWGYDPHSGLVVRWAGHNQGGGGEQHSETWTFNPATAEWALKHTNDSPPGECCAQQNIMNPLTGRFIRFGGFSGNHGWQWFREIYLKQTSVWSYDVAANHWRDMRPLPAPRTGGLRCASWDSDHQVIVVFAGEGIHEGTVIYDPYTNEWLRPKPPDEPEPRSGGNMVYDEARKVHILFGSQFSDDKHTWAYDLRANRWRDLKPPEQPPTDRNDAVLTYDSVNKVIVALIKHPSEDDEKAAPRIETWLFDAGKKRWTRANPPREPDASGNRARLLTFLPGHNVALLETRTHPPHGPAEQQIWTYRAAGSDGATAEHAAMHLHVAAIRGHARLTWEGGNSEWGTVIYRGEGNNSWEAELKPVATLGQGAAAYKDEVGDGKRVFHYQARRISPAKKEGPPSTLVSTRPSIVDNVVASVRSENEVALTWTHPRTRLPSGHWGERGDIAGYVVERAVVEVYSEDELQRLKKQTPPLAKPSVGALRRIGPFTRITKELLTDYAYSDRIDLSKPAKIDGEPIWKRERSNEDVDTSGRPYAYGVYAYRVRAVNNLGVESGPSPYCLTIPSAPQDVYSREKDTACELKWKANPEKGLTGYRVYRMNGRYDKDPIVRLTDAPISETSYTDPDAGKDTRRYYLVAVDALGQEGLPSQPVWFDREWKDFYKPFVQDWHQ